MIKAFADKQALNKKQALGATQILRSVDDIGELETQKKTVEKFLMESKTESDKAKQQALKVQLKGENDKLEKILERFQR